VSGAVYRMFRRVEVPSVRTIVIAMIAIACVLTGVGVIRVTRQHEVLRLGYQLSRDAERVRVLREVQRRLELERGALTSPDRIRRLAMQLGMTSVAPDRIRIVDVPPKVASQP